MEGILTPEFRDYYHQTWNRDQGPFSQLSPKEIEENTKRIEETLLSFNGDVKLLGDYLQKASATSDSEIQIMLYIVLTGNCGFENITDDLKKVLQKYREHLEAIKEYNKRLIKTY